MRSAERSPTETGGAGANPTFHQVVDCLEACGEQFSLLDLGGGARLIVTRYGGRFMGPFFGVDEECPLWLPRMLADAGGLSAAVRGRSWNVGGDRIWIAPELQYNVRDRTRFRETYELQDAVDPGAYTLEPGSPTGFLLSQEMHLLSYNHKDRRKHLRVLRRVRAVDDPLRDVQGYRAFAGDLCFAGYEQEVTLTDSKPDELYSQAWNITQVPPGGVAIVPTVPALEYADHETPADADHLHVSRHHLSARIKSDCGYKIELKAAHHFGRSGYYRALAPGRAVLMVKLYFNNPSEHYVMEAPGTPGIRGYSFDIYHDDGGLGGFGEIKCHGRPIGGESARSSSVDQFVNWFYIGSETAVRAAALHLLGIEI